MLERFMYMTYVFVQCYFGFVLFALAGLIAGEIFIRKFLIDAIMFSIADFAVVYMILQFTMAILEMIYSIYTLIQDGFQYLWQHLADQARYRVPGWSVDRRLPHQSLNLASPKIDGQRTHWDTWNCIVGSLVQFLFIALGFTVVQTVCEFQLTWNLNDAASHMAQTFGSLMHARSLVFALWKSLVLLQAMVRTCHLLTLCCRAQMQRMMEVVQYVACLSCWMAGIHNAIEEDNHRYKQLGRFYNAKQCNFSYKRGCDFGPSFNLVQTFEDQEAAHGPRVSSVRYKATKISNFGQGACLWRALAQSVAGDAQRWRKIKQDVLRANPSLRYQRKSCKWGDEKALQAAANLLGRDIEVYIPRLTTGLFHRGQCTTFFADQPEKPRICLELRGQHFQLLKHTFVLASSSDMDWQAYKFSSLDSTDWVIHQRKFNPNLIELTGGGKGKQKSGIPLKPSHPDLHGGGTEPDGAELGRLTQKVSSKVTIFTKKQIRALLLLDAKAREKITNSDSDKAITDIIIAAGKRIGMHPMREFAAPPDVPEPKGNKGKGKTKTKDSSKGDGTAKGVKGNAKGKNVNANPAQNAKGDSPIKGKGKSAKGAPSGPPSFTLIDDDWAIPVKKIEEFDGSNDGVYLTQDLEVAQTLLPKIRDKTKNILVVMPAPHAIGFGAAEEKQIRLRKVQDTIEETVLVTSFVHTLAGKMVDLKFKGFPTTAAASKRTCALRIRICEKDAAIQQAVQKKQLNAIRQWVENRLQTELIDLWYIRAVADELHINIRVHSRQVGQIMCASTPSLQVDSPRQDGPEFKPVWLRKDGRALEFNEAETIAKKLDVHFGMFTWNGTIAIRVPPEKYPEVKASLGQSSIPVFRIQHLPSQYINEDVEELLQAIQWKATIIDGSRRFRNGGLEFLLRSDSPPPMTVAPFNFGYERRIVRIEPTQKAPQKPVSNANGTPNKSSDFPSFSSQLKKGKGGTHAPRAATQGISFDLTGSDAGNKRQRVATPQKPHHANHPPAADATPDYSRMDTTQIAQVIQGLQEQMSALTILLESRAVDTRMDDDLECCGLFDDDGAMGAESPI